MASMKWASSWVDAVAPIKSNIRALFRDEVASYQTLAELQANTLAATRLVLVGGVPFLLDAADVTSTDNGANILVSADGYRYKMVTGFREKLTANRTYYVRTDGSDSNDGLANTSGRAFLTIQKAINAVAAIDLSIYDVTIKLGNTGTYTGNVVVTGPWLGTGNVTLQGDTTTPANTIVTCAVGNTIHITAGGRLRVDAFRVQSTTANALTASVGGRIFIVNGKMEFGAAGFGHIAVYTGGVIDADYAAAAYKIVAGAVIHLYAELGGTISLRGSTITLTGTPAFSYAYCNCVVGSKMFYDGNTFSGSATGTRYDINLNSVVMVSGAGATYLPGNVAGGTGTGGQYA
jgi:hypothetical protein